METSEIKKIDQWHMNSKSLRV